MKYTLYILSSFLLFIVSCNTKPGSSSNDNSHLRTPVYTEPEESFNFSEFLIAKHHLGRIYVGDDIKDVDSIIHNLTKQEIEAWELGFDGGGVAYLYLFEDEPVFGLIPAYETDSIIGIVALHTKLKSKNGIHPGMTAGNLSSYYPNELFYEDLLTGREALFDSLNSLIFVFETDSTNRIGMYPEIEVGSTLINPDPEIDWVLIR